MSLKIITFKDLSVPGLLDHANRLPKSGVIQTSDQHFTCLSINDNFIHKLYPYFQALNPCIQKPDYFGEDDFGAHITVIYPEESVVVEETDIGSTHHFSLIHPFSADLGTKRYFGLRVKANTLLQLRQKYGLGKRLQFKRYLVELHITIGFIIS